MGSLGDPNSAEGPGMSETHRSLVHHGMAMKAVEMKGRLKNETTKCHRVLIIIIIVLSFLGGVYLVTLTHPPCYYLNLSPSEPIRLL